jgi:hypothetical protein
MRRSRGNFSLLTLLVAVVTTGGLIALNVDATGDSGWPFMAFYSYYPWMGNVPHIAGLVIRPANAALDVLINVAVLSSIAVTCEYCCRRGARRAQVNAVSS